MRHFLVPSLFSRTTKHHHDTMTSTSPQALVDSLCSDIRPYLIIPATFQEHHLQQLANAIEHESEEKNEVKVQHVTVAAGMKAPLQVLFQQVTLSLTQLDIEEPSIYNMTSIMNLIRETSTLTTLALHQIPHSTMPDLIQALLQNTCIRVLDLSNNEFDDSDEQVIGPLIRLLQESTTIECLMLHRNAFSEISWLTGALQRNTSIRMLSLADNQITNLQPLAALLQHNVTLQRLYLHGNKFHYSDKYKLQCSHYLRLNVVGRQLLIHQGDIHVGLYARILARVSKEPSLLYGLLRELPQAWTQTRR